MQTAFYGPPSQFEYTTRKLGKMSLSCAYGIHNKWDVPFAVWHAPAGMEVSLPAFVHATVTVLHHRSLFRRVDKSGRGAQGGTSRNAVLMYGGGFDRHYHCKGDASCDQIYLTRELITNCGLDLYGTSEITLREDRLFLDDGPLRLAVQGYAQRGQDQNLPPTRLEMNARATMIALHLVRQHSDKSRPKPKDVTGLDKRRLKLILERVDANLDGDLRVADLAAEVGLAPSQFHAAFRASVGTSPHVYVLERRVAVAKDLLRGTKSLAEIALICGFSSQQHFCTAFRAQVGAPPGAWRQNARGEIADGSRMTDAPPLRQRQAATF